MEVDMKPKVKKSGLNAGDKVILINCYEARSGKYDNVIFTVIGEPREMCGSEVAEITSSIKRFPTFATEFLLKVS
jgi:hypothetical protein